MSSLILSCAIGGERHPSASTSRRQRKAWRNKLPPAVRVGRVHKSHHPGFLNPIFIFALSAFLCGQIDHRNIFLAAKERKERKKWIKKSIIPFLIFIFIFAFSAFLCGQIDHRNVFLAAKERKERKKIGLRNPSFRLPSFIFIFAFSAFLCGQIEHRNMFS
jgi:uncharacterized PurR-regulated membrane protein YhhQ (DUF165 family)